MYKGAHCKLEANVNLVCEAEHSAKKTVTMGAWEMKGCSLGSFFNELTQSIKR